MISRATSILVFFAALLGQRNVAGGSREHLNADGPDAFTPAVAADFLSLLANLGVLGFFKYFHFFSVSVAHFLQWLGLPASESTLSIFLPYGISFYTFQSMSYSIDVYRRRLQPVRSFLDLACFISFFPQLVAGPIVRAMTFLPQVFETRVLANVQVRACFTLFFIGSVYKA